MELILKTSIEQLVPAAIEFNFDEIKAELEHKLKRYNDLVVTENAIKEAKTDKASLNSLAKTLSDNRIANERVYMQPFNEYKGKINQLIALIKEPVVVIDAQIKGFEDKEKEVKLNEITRFYDDNINNFKDILPLEKILNPKWANKTTTLLSITQEIIDKIITVQNDFRVIEAMKLGCETLVKDTYLRNFSMSDALAEKTRFEEQQEKLAMLNQAPQPVADKPITPCRPTIQMPIKLERIGEDALTDEVLKTIRVQFFDTTQAFRDELRALTTRHEITYGGVNNGSN